MKTEIIVVPKGKNPMDVIASMGERTRNTLILVHEDAIREIIFRAATELNGMACLDACEELLSKSYLKCYWPKSETVTETLVKIEWIRDSDFGYIFEIDSAEIAFKKPKKGTEEVLIFMME